MTKCKQCNVTISDNTTICPLCQCVVEPALRQSCITPAYQRGIVTSESAAPLNEYPDVWIRERKLKMICNISFFAILLASALLAVLNYAFFSGSWWCLVPIASLAYAYLVFRLVLISRKGYRVKMLIPLLFAMLLVLLIDIENGFTGWSLNYVLPSGILLVDVIIIILMLTNMKNWQSYIIMQIGMIAVSAIPIVLWITGIITSPLLTLIAAGVSVFIFLGALIIGDRTARGELKRRFHIR